VKSARRQAVQNVADWLENLGMSEYAQGFAENRIDFSVLPDLTDQDLKDLGVVLGDRRKMQRAIAKLDATPEAVALMPKAASAPSVAAVQPVPVAEESSGRHHVTVMLCDLVDSTHLAAKLDPEEWRERVDAYLDAASAAVTEMGGKVAKKLAYGLLALFGYPAAQENDSERAVRSAFATQRALTELNRINVGRPALAAGIAIDSGPVAIDAAGPILGEMSNIVAQAQALAGPGAVVVTARVQRQVAGLFVVNERGSNRLVPEAVTLYRIVRATSGEHPRPNYHRLIVRAVNRLDMSTAEARQAVYERARKAAVARLSFNQPALSKADIAKECLALEEAIRKVEADAARKSPTQTPAERSATPPAGAPDGGAQAASRPLQRNRANPPPADQPWAGWPTELPDAREQLLSGRDAYEEEAPQYPAEEPAASSHKFEPHLDSEDVNSVDYDTWQERDLELAYEPEEEQPRAVPPVRHRSRSMAPADEYERTRPALFYGGLVRLLVVLIILAGVVAMVSWQWSVITEFYQSFSHTGTRLQNRASQKTPSTLSKFSGRAPQEQDTVQAPGAPVPGAQAAPAVAQQVVLHEEDRNDQQDRRYMGSAMWRTETVSPGAGLAPELAVLADAEIPERRMTVAWSLRRNVDKALPASHTIEIKFNLPADFPGGGIANVSGILMAQAEQARGSPLAGLAVKVTDGFFVIGLSAVDPDMQRNEQLLKGRSWFYIPIVYANGGRAILAMEKGPPGDRAFVEAFAAWEKK
jgi:class 3 adenylate cyclase